MLSLLFVECEVRDSDLEEDATSSDKRRGNSKRHKKFLTKSRVGESAQPDKSPCTTTISYVVDEKARNEPPEDKIEEKHRKAVKHEKINTNCHTCDSVYITPSNLPTLEDEQIWKIEMAGSKRTNKIGFHHTGKLLVYLL